MSNRLIIDDNVEEVPGDINQLKKDLSEAVTRRSDDTQEHEVPEQTASVPEKYRGKSVEDVIEMHRNAESELGRRSNELGQYKKLTDELLNLKRHNDLAKGGAELDEPEQEPLPEISSTDLLENPTDAVTRLLDARDKRTSRQREFEEAQRAREAETAEFAAQHPDAAQIANDPEFVNWVKDTPSRTLLGVEAAEGNLRAGAALLSEWKSLQEAGDTPPAEEKADPKAEARKAATESVGSSTTPDAPSGKIYRRLDLIRLKLEDPEAYADDAFQREILKAYAEGRVK